MFHTNYEDWLNEEAENRARESVHHVKKWIIYEEKYGDLKETPVSVLFRVMTKALVSAGFRISSKSTWDILSFSIITEHEDQTFVSVQYNTIGIHVTFHTHNETYRAIDKNGKTIIRPVDLDTDEKASRFIAKFLHSLDQSLLTSKNREFLENYRGNFAGDTTGIL
jgi:hypothetical protein